MKKVQLTPQKIIALLELHKGKLKKYTVKRIGIFGSYLKRSQTRKSDLDFLVTFDNYIGLKFFLENLFHKKIDLVIERDLKPQLAYVKEEAKYAKGL